MTSTTEDNFGIQRTFAKPLSEKLKEIGFEQVDFEPVVLNRFIVRMDDVPSYVICGAKMPNCVFDRNSKTGIVEKTWDPLVLFLYNPVKLDIEKRILELGQKGNIKIDIQYLTPDGDIATHWKINSELSSVNYGEFSWKNTGDPNIIQLTFKIKSATL
jgi:hypothetical protein